MRSHWWTRRLRGLSGLMFVLLVAACGGGGGGGGDNPGGGGGGGDTTDTTAPSVPTGLTAQAVSAAQIDLAWTASTDDVGVTAYKILRGGTQVTSATGTAWQNTGLTANTQYCYTVAAVDAAGNASTETSQVCATTQTLAADTSAPTVPVGLTATAISASQIDLAWAAAADNIGVTGYKVFRAGNEITSNVVTNYQNSGLTPNTNYCYTVSAYDAAGNTSAQTTQACVTTQSGVVTDSSPPSVPTNLAVTAVSSSQIDLRWTPSTDNVAVTGYTLYRSGVQLATNATTSYQNTGLTASTQYCYTVAAVDAAGNASAQNSQACAVTEDAPAATLVSIAVTPANLSIEISATQQFTATGTYSDNTVQNITGSVTWSSSNNAITTVNTSGLGTGIAAGTVTITAISNAISGSTSFTITTPPIIPAAGIWSGGGIKFYVSSDGGSLTATGSPINSILNVSLALYPYAYGNCGFSSVITLLNLYDSTINDNAFTSSGKCYQSGSDYSGRYTFFMQNFFNAYGIYDSATSAHGTAEIFITINGVNESCSYSWTATNSL